jgi:hypothetical protein
VLPLGLVRRGGVHHLHHTLLPKAGNDTFPPSRRKVLIPRETIFFNPCWRYKRRVTEANALDLCFIFPTARSGAVTFQLDEFSRAFILAIAPAS